MDLNVQWLHREVLCEQKESLLAADPSLAGAGKGKENLGGVSLSLRLRAATRGALTLWSVGRLYYCSNPLWGAQPTF